MVDTQVNTHTQVNETTPFPRELVKAVFDNNKKIGKTHLIGSDNKVLATAMTSCHLWITLGSKSKIQDSVSLKPDGWGGTV